MKQTKIKLLCLLLAALMLLSSLTACGKDKAKDSNLIKLGDYELLYKGACIMEDSDGNDAIVLTLDFTNNGKENASYLWSVDETLMQNGVELEAATVGRNGHHGVQAAHCESQERRPRHLHGRSPHGGKRRRQLCRSE